MPIKKLSDYPPRASTCSRPLISVVTTVRNGAAGLKRTISSVAGQDLLGLEYIVVDGDSTDGTLDIIRSNLDNISCWISEPDDGISDGFNKGIALSTGQYITLVHADDWLSPGQLRCGLEALERSGADFVFGDLLFYRAGIVSHRVRGDADYGKRIAHVMPSLNHPTVILRREVYAINGLFDTDYRFAMDYELLLRLHRAGVRGVYVPGLTGHMSLAGASDRNGVKALAEVRRASIRHGYSQFKAWPFFAFRVVKMILRHSAEKYLPHQLHQKLRERVNRNFSGAA